MFASRLDWSFDAHIDVREIGLTREIEAHRVTDDPEAAFLQNVLRPCILIEATREDALFARTPSMIEHSPSCLSSIARSPIWLTKPVAKLDIGAL